MQCSACKKMLQGDFNFCPYCGNKTNRACPGCGKEMMADWVTCPYCRAALGQAGVVPPPPPPTSQQYPPTSHGYPQGHNHGHSNYHSDSSGHRNKRKKGLLGSFFS